MSRPRFTNAELRVLRAMLMFKRDGHYDKESNRWVYDSDLYRKVNAILQARRKGNGEVK